MIAVSISMAQRRLLVFVATTFFISSVYLCTTRLFANSFSVHSGYAPDIDSFDSGLEGVSVDMTKVELTRADKPMSYGHFKRPFYDDIRLVGALPKELVPTAKNKRRLIIFGDIHGMVEPFNVLLEKTRYDSTRDHIIAVGDMVNKGPNSVGVVSRLMDLNASAVRGNHEDRVLVAWAAHNLQRGVESALADTDAERHRGEYDDLTTARALPEEQMKWLAGLPAILTVDPLSLYVVHAGLVPGVDLEAQDPWAVMHMRSFIYPRADFRAKEEEKRIKDEAKKKEKELKKQEEEKERKKQEELDRQKKETAATGKERVRRVELGSSVSDLELTSEVLTNEELLIQHPKLDSDVLLPIETHDGDAWSDVWNHAQHKLASRKRRTIIYGHDSKSGYKEDSYSIGIDSGCVGGGALSALIVEASHDSGFQHFTVQVACKEG